MSSNVGLSTPRGTGTSGYVQRNLSHLRPRDNAAPYPRDFDSIKHRQRQPDASILDHDEKRDIEVKVFELRDRLEDEEIDEEEIETQTSALRKKLLAIRENGGDRGSKGRPLKMHQVHEMAKAKIEESERLRKALGISTDYEEGSHWKRQEEKMRNTSPEIPETTEEIRSNP
ncbi:MAG: RNA-splicing factor [Trizodia sp. TS-e1964]|nr:MAG: RNA-splicing factor [Trizodia sp. TS-e1964]